jgi:hypothetical protein
VAESHTAAESRASEVCFIFVYQTAAVGGIQGVFGSRAWHPARKGPRHRRPCGPLRCPPRDESLMSPLAELRNFDA